MKIFELHFNPGTKEEKVFDTFCYEPENIYEKRLGFLFLVGELKNVLPQNLKFLDELADFFKHQYYSTSIKDSQETSFKESLRKLNEHLEKIAKSGDVSWLGNLNLALFSLKNFDLNFTKTGDVKILLFQNGQCLDIGKNLESEDLEPYPLKIFSRIVTGKLAENNVLLVLTNELFENFSNLNLLEKLTKAREEKILKEILKQKEKELSRVAGVCLVCFLTKEVDPLEKKSKVLAFQKEFQKFSIGQIFLSFVEIFKKIPPTFSFKKNSLIRKINLKCPFKNIPKFGQPKIKLEIKKPQLKISAPTKKNLFLILLLVFFLFLGFFIFKKEKNEKLKNYQMVLKAGREKILEADNFIFLKNEEKAFSFLKEAWEEIKPLTKEKYFVEEEALSLVNELEEKMKKISNLEEITEPKLFFEFDQKEFVPEKMVYFQKNLYFFNSFSQNIFRLSLKKEKTILKTENKFSKATVVNDLLLFFQKPNRLFFLENNEIKEFFDLKIPYPEFNPIALASFYSNLYFLDGNKGEIIKYPILSQVNEFPQLWLKKETKKSNQGKSLAVDGSIWVLNKDNSLSHYFKGEFQKVFNLKIFPFPKDISKISARAGLIYLLEPVQWRIIVLNNSGKTIKQLFSRNFDNLLDFALSEDGKTIWVLNGFKVYQLEISLTSTQP